MLLDNTADDFKWYMRDREAYEAEMAREYEERNRQFAEHMGPDYQELYKFTKKELEFQLEERLKRIKRMKELGAPDLVVEHEQNLINEISTSLVNGVFLKTQADKAYREGYERRQKTFNFIFEVRKPDPDLLKD
jgi:hypothetical protein